MKKIWMTAAGVALAGATALATMPAQAFWGSWGGGPWYGGPWYGGPWWGGPYGYGYPYGGYGYPYGGWGGWCGYPYGGYGYGYPYAYAPVVAAPAAPAAPASTSAK